MECRPAGIEPDLMMDRIGKKKRKRFFVCPKPYRTFSMAEVVSRLIGILQVLQDRGVEITVCGLWGKFEAVCDVSTTALFI